MSERSDIASRSGGGAAPSVERKTKIESGMGSDSGRWSLKGAEPLTPGLTVFFDLEFGFESDSGAGTTALGDGLLRMRRNYLGLTGTYGTSLLGRVDRARATFVKQHDSFEGAGVGSYGGISTHLTTANNALVYVTPEWQGLSVTGVYVTAATTDEAPGDLGVTRIYVFWPTYKIGNLQINWDHEEVWLAKSGGPRLKVNDIGASYDVGVAKVFCLIDKTKTDNGLFIAVIDDQTGYLLGATVPVSTNGVAKASVARVKRDNIADFSCCK